MRSVLYALLCLLFSISLTAQNPNPTDSIGKSTAKKDSTGAGAIEPKPAVDSQGKPAPAVAPVPSVKLFKEVLLVSGSAYQVTLVNSLPGQYRVLLEKGFTGLQADTGVLLPAMDTSKVLIGAQVEYLIFRNILLELMSIRFGWKMARIDSTLSTHPDLEYQFSKIYKAFFFRIQELDNPVIAGLRETLELQNGILAEKDRYAGQLKFRELKVPTYQHLNDKTFKEHIKKQKEQIDSKEKKVYKELTEAMDLLDKVYEDEWEPSDSSQFKNLVGKAYLPDSSIKFLERKIDSLQEHAYSLRGQKKQIENKYVKTKGEFFPDYVLLQFFNSAVDKMVIKGSFRKDSTDRESKPIRFNHPIRAANRSFGLRNLNTSDYYFPINQGTTNEYAILLSDLLEYAPYQKNFAYIVKDQSVELWKDSIHAEKMYRRELYDYLTLISFVDFLGVSNEFNNNLIQIEGRARFPLQLSTLPKSETFRNLTFFPLIETYLNASFVNGNNVGGRKADVFMNKSKDTLFYDHFDLLRNYNIKTGISAGIFSLQYKSIHCRIYGTWDLKMYRTSFSYTNITEGADSIIQSNLFALSHGPSLLFEYRPDFNIGADLRLSMDCSLNPLNAQNNTLHYLPSEGPLYAKQQDYQEIKRKRVYGIELNAYSFLSPQKEKNDGIYFRLAIFANHNLTQISPYILAGYATSLKGLVKTKKDGK